MGGLCSHPKANLRTLEACCPFGATSLDGDQVKVALHAHGLYPSVNQIQAAVSMYSDTELVNFEDFQHIMIELSGRCESGLKALPHSWRGLQLRQLRKLHEQFVATGWLLKQCECFNIANEMAINNRTVYNKFCNLYALNEFLITPVTGTDAGFRSNIPANELAEAGIPHAPESTSSFAQLLNPEGVKVVKFVSHYWGHDFNDTMQALGMIAEDACMVSKESRAASGGVAIEKKRPEDVVFWICLFCLNQHELLQEMGSCPYAAPFNIALSHATQGAVMILDHDVQALRRIWCLYEVHRAQALGQPFMMATENQVLGTSSASTFETWKLEEIKNVLSLIEQTSAFAAASTIEDDRLDILYSILDKSRKPFFPTFETFKQAALNPANEGDKVDAAHFHDFNSHVRKILATPLLDYAVNIRDAHLAFQCIGFGASCMVSRLQSLMEASADLDSVVSVSFLASKASMPLVYCMSDSGRIDELRFLLENGANPDQIVDIPSAEAGPARFPKIANGSTALLRAAWIGHVPIVSLLLEKRADPNACSSNGWTALIVCGFSVGTSAAVATLLLENRANVHTTNRTKISALHTAGSGGASGQDELTPLLLNFHADPNALDDDGSSPLHYAAFWGNSVAILFLIQHAADLNAQRDDGATPLHRAARSGREAAVPLLLQHSSNIEVLDNNGQTPLQIASQHNTKMLPLLRTSDKLHSMSV